MKYIPKSSEGFTAVELLVTIIVAAMFAVSLYQLLTVVTTTSSAARSRATASDVAYANLRKYASANSTPTWFTCSTASGASNTNDVTVNSSAAGSTLISGTLVPTTVGLPGPVSYSVKALAIFGCSGVNTGKPIRVESQVTYGPQNTVIKHSTLVGY